MMRKNLNTPSDLADMPSLLGSLFRKSLSGVDSFDYNRYVKGNNDVKLEAWNGCRKRLGMHMPPDKGSSERQQYIS